MDEQKIIDNFTNSNRHMLPFISVFEKLSSVFIKYLESVGIYIHSMKGLSRTIRKDSWKCWKYSGGFKGHILHYFNNSADFYADIDDSKVSVSRYDFPHFIADSVDISKFIEWAKSNEYMDEFLSVCKQLNIVNEDS